MNDITEAQVDHAINVIAQWNVQCAQSDVTDQDINDLAEEYVCNDFERINFKIKELIDQPVGVEWNGGDHFRFIGEEADLKEAGIAPGIVDHILTTDPIGCVINGLRDPLKTYIGMAMSIKMEGQRMVLPFRLLEKVDTVVTDYSRGDKFVYTGSNSSLPNVGKIIHIHKACGFVDAYFEGSVYQESVRFTEMEKLP